MSYPVWNIHLPQPDGAPSLRCTTDSDTSSKSSSYNDLGGRNANIYVDIPSNMKVGSILQWAGYIYNVKSITYGNPTSSYNRMTDIPNCTPSKDSPDIPSPHGSIDITAKSTGKLAVSDESQVNLAAGTSTIRISIPVYKITDILKLPKNAQGYIPVSKEQLTADDVGTIQTSSKDGILPAKVTALLNTGNQVVYYRDPNPENGCIIVPTFGLAIANNVTPPSLSSERIVGKHIMRSVLNDNTLHLILPDNKGTSSVLSANLRQLKTKLSEGYVPPPGAGIPVVMMDQDGKQVNAQKSDAESSSSNPMAGVTVAFRQLLIFLIIIMASSATFMFMPYIPTDDAAGINTILLLGVSFVLSLVLAGVEITPSGKVVAEKDTPVISIVMLIELCLTIVTVFGVMMYWKFNPTSMSSMGDIISYGLVALIICLSVMTLSFNISLPFTDKSSYNTQFQMTPLYYNRITTILKFIAPILLTFLLSGSSPIMNLMVNLGNITEHEGTPIPYTKSSELLQKHMMKLFGDSTDIPSSILNKAQVPLMDIQRSLVQMKNGPWKNTLVAKTQQNTYMMINKNTGESVIKQTLDSITSDKTLEPSKFLKTQDIGGDYTDVWFYTVAFGVSMFLFSTLSLPSFSGDNAFKFTENSDGETDKTKTLSGKIIDMLYGLVLPIIASISIWNMGYQHTGNTYQMILLLLGPIGALILNIISIISSFRE